ncbi:MAG: hypothetical protein R3A51_15770 [Nannocystaceae bacterium]
MTRLVELGEEGVSTRRRVELTAVEPTDAEARAIFHDVLAQLVDARLLVRNDDAGATTIEVAHEALIRKWPRMSRWIEEDRDKIGQPRDARGPARPPSSGVAAGRRVVRHVRPRWSRATPKTSTAGPSRW